MVDALRQESAMSGPNVVNGASGAFCAKALNGATGIVNVKVVTPHATDHFYWPASP